MSQYKPATNAELKTAVDAVIAETWDPNDDDISNWDTSLMTDMSGLFFNKSTFNRDISGWNTSNVTKLNDMFYGASVFNGDLSGWNTSNVTNMKGMFNKAERFNGDISGWIVSKVTDMGFMFYDASVFNGDLSGWDTSNVTDMVVMFYDAFAFNGDLSGWDTSNVTNMGQMFRYASTFNGDLSGWDVSKVTNMGGMFRDTNAFNGDISGWDVSNVTNMESMFRDANAFNIDIRVWDANGVYSYMFTNATNMHVTYAGSTGFGDTPTSEFFSTISPIYISQSISRESIIDISTLSKSSVITQYVIVDSNNNKLIENSFDGNNVPYIDPNNNNRIEFIQVELPPDHTEIINNDNTSIKLFTKAQSDVPEVYGEDADGSISYTSFPWKHMEDGSLSNTVNNNWLQSDNYNIDKTVSILTSVVAPQGMLSFNWKCSTEAVWDNMMFAITPSGVNTSWSRTTAGVNSLEYQVISGETDMTTVTFDLSSYNTTETLQLHWVYFKDWSMSENLDSAYLDNITLSDGISYELSKIYSYPMQYTSHHMFTGQSMYNYYGIDGSGNTTNISQLTFDVTIPATNEIPVAINDTAVSYYGNPITIDVLANDTDADGDVLTVTATSATDGSVLINTDNTLEFTPNVGFFGTHTVSYTASDGQGGTTDGEVLVVSEICLVEGTQVLTDQGYIAIEKIDVTKHTIDKQHIVTITKTVNTSPYLICVKKSALGENVPSQDTIMSKDHMVSYKGGMLNANRLEHAETNVCNVDNTKTVLYNVLLESYSKMIVNNMEVDTLHHENMVAKMSLFNWSSPAQKREFVNEYNVTDGSHTAEYYLLCQQIKEQ